MLFFALFYEHDRMLLSINSMEIILALPPLLFSLPRPAPALHSIVLAQLHHHDKDKYK